MDYLWHLTHDSNNTGQDSLPAGQPQAATVRQVHDALGSTRDIAYTTVMTVLDRLAKKGAVEQIRDGRAYLYRPAVSLDELTAELMHDALGNADGANRASALVRFVDTASADDAAALRAALAELERRDDVT
ncbi:BlaI/MecI/CopY family transcriptional regulator [Phytoactinopolyspora mesophila]|uniref:BlaI/MecI/CopY family transcriptional regulator n=1 Tax=Phytoactinopolyspora mesophila TaxID=2650750 RepID=A0A7K3M6C9_9ACTN|nr:BlaI/MecI/CopY family transcriptional regulator [Phytoactinopolyspora mesophila]NDL58442.1 BlaI/MecI/CopY family transcriptional regulator [Phytoactinopolyspora mesophila]